jgi:hypothetical protein
LEITLLSPPQTGAILLALLLAGPIVFLSRYVESTSEVIPKAPPFYKDQFQETFQSIPRQEDSILETHVVKAEKIITEPVSAYSKFQDRVSQELPKKIIEPLLMDREEDPPHDVCQKDGGHKVKHGRHGWRCVYPEEHRHHHRRRR